MIIVGTSSVVQGQSLLIPREKITTEEINMAECAVCGSHVSDDVPTADVEHDGSTYYFESAKCKEMFEEDPSDYS
jgi:YHS domain-containing protein